MVKHNFGETTRFIYLFVLAFVLCHVGCVGPIALQQALPAYDETISQLERDSLLINIARTRHKLPMHFTTTTDIAATFEFTASAGLQAEIPIGSTSMGITTITPFSLSTSASENPTIGLTPLQGEEFSKRLLSPFNNPGFKLLIEQRTPIDMVMRLTAHGFVFMKPDGSYVRYVRNSPDSPDEYEEFRRIALHLTTLAANNELFAGNLTFDETQRVTLSSPPSLSEAIQAIEDGYQYKAVPGTQAEYEVAKRITGSFIIMNVQPTTLSNDELIRLNSLVESTPPGWVLVVIRQGYPGGNYPIFGAIELRSLNEMFSFIAAGIAEKPEYNVDPDPRTARLQENTLVDRKMAYVLRNPLQTLAIVESENPPTYYEALSVYYSGAYYYVANTPWDREAFNVLYLIFNMSTEATTQRGFPITISK